MSPVTIIWSMVAAACLTLAAIHLLVWFQHRARHERLALALMATATAGIAFVELRMMMATSPGEFAAALRWLHPPVWLGFIAVVAFVRLYLNAGRWWLAGAAIGLRTLSLVVNFLSELNINYVEIGGLRQLDFLGDRVVVAVGTPNPWLAAAQAALLLLVVFILDAAVQVWRRGERRRAVLVGGSVACWVILGTVQAILAFWNLIDVPFASSLYCAGMIATMAFELSLDTLRARDLAEELRSTEEGKRREVAHLGRVAAMGELSVSLAHEMNQPLGIILSNAQTAQRLLDRGNPDLAVLRGILDDIVAENIRAGEVIRRMRALLQRGESQHRPLCLNEVVAEVLRLTRGLLADRGVVVETSLAAGLPRVSADRVQIQQVLLNLLLNACEAMDASPHARVVELSTHGEGRGVRLSVADHGRGLPAEVEPLFQPFHTTKEQGLGMGLAICRSIAAAHHGELWAEPAAGGGAAFHLVLPSGEPAP